MTRPKKSLGQHFLVDPVIISRIIEALNPQPGEQVLEIGPGRGALTMPLIHSGAEITAVELDRELAPALERRLGAHDNFRIIEADILTVDPTSVGLKNFALVGNLPYNITTPVMDWLMTYHTAVDRALLMMQKEVAERVSSPPGRRARSTISVLTELYYDSETVCEVPPESFSPPPKVDSAVIELIRHDHDYDIGDKTRFEKFVRFCFKSKRKSLLNNLNAAYPIRREELDELISDICGGGHIRAEQLDLATMIRLSRTVFDRL